MFEYGAFRSHSGLILPWKLNCDDFTDRDWDCVSRIIARKFAYAKVFGVPTGGLKMAEACNRFTAEGYPILIVDDVLTLGSSIEEQRAKAKRDYPGVPTFGVTVFSRQPLPGAFNDGAPKWVWTICTVSEWAQCRGTGVG
jgi:hypothetical protein